MIPTIANKPQSSYSKQNFALDKLYKNIHTLLFLDADTSDPTADYLAFTFLRVVFKPGSVSIPDWPRYSQADLVLY